MIPGSNLLGAAFQLIKQDSFTYYRFASNPLNNIGMYVPTYDAPVELTGSIQAVSRQVMQDLGLDWTKRHIEVWVEQDVLDLSRDQHPDQISFNGRRFDIIGQTDWHPIDGWDRFMAVDVGEES